MLATQGGDGDPGLASHRWGSAVEVVVAGVAEDGDALPSHGCAFTEVGVGDKAGDAVVSQVVGFS